MFLVGCASSPKVPKTIIKEVPVIVYKNPPAPAEVLRPSLPIDDLTEQATNDEIAKAYVSSLELLKIYARRLELALEPYRKLDDNE